MPLEKEFKFLIDYPDEAELASYPGSDCSQIDQVYLISPQGSLRIRKREWASGQIEYTKTCKYYVREHVRQEEEQVIDESSYQTLLLQADPACRVLQKRRWRIPYAGLVYEIDLYPFWHDRAVLEVEVEREDQPIPLAPFVRYVRDISQDRRYSNYNLSRLDFNPCMGM